MLIQKELCISYSLEMLCLVLLQNEKAEPEKSSLIQGQTNSSALSTGARYLIWCESQVFS